VEKAVAGAQPDGRGAALVGAGPELAWWRRPDAGKMRTVARRQPEGAQVTPAVGCQKGVVVLATEVAPRPSG
jgi:hypothetical protein